jgi:hypothetical protein
MAMSYANGWPFTMNNSPLTVYLTLNSFLTLLELLELTTDINEVSIHAEKAYEDWVPRHGQSKEILCYMATERFAVLLVRLGIVSWMFFIRMREADFCEEFAADRDGQELLEILYGTRL